MTGSDNARRPSRAASESRMTLQALRLEHPHLFILDPADAAGVGVYLHRHGLLGRGETVTRLERAGEGNMNCTLRAYTASRTLIVKQSRPWVEKYPQFAAPWDRAIVEAEFYRIIAHHPHVAAFLPTLLFSDPDSRVLVIEDLGDGGDYTRIYRGEVLDSHTVLPLADFLSGLHGAFPPGGRHPPLPNSEMRTLNHAHVFAIPLQPDNGLDLDTLAPGLRAAAAPLLAPSKFHDEVVRLGREVYLADGPTLVHGDFFPGSLVRTGTGPRVIDPEFCHFGRAELDVGVLLAHLILGAQPRALWLAFRDRYVAPPSFEDGVARQLAGIEIMRRLIGYAQLPNAWDLAARVALLNLARDLVLVPGTPPPPWPCLS